MFLMFWCKDNAGSPPLSQFIDATDDIVSARSLSLCSSAEARALVPYEIAVRMHALPLSINGKDQKRTLFVAADYEDAAEKLRELQFATQLQVKLIKVSYGTVLEAIFLAYRGSEQKLASAARELPMQRETGKRIDAPVSIFEGQGSICAFLSTLIEYAVARHASDIHLIPANDGTLLKLRIDGDLHIHESPLGSSQSHAQIIRRLKVLSKLDVSKHDCPQDGAFRLALHHGTFHLRLSILPTLHGEKAVLRILGQNHYPTIASLGFSAPVERALQSMLQEQEGLVLFIGATGSGKTTSMYSMIQESALRGLNVCTVEDPIEIELPCASQSQVNLHQGLDYASCLRAVLRQDPDVILVGELRDGPSAMAAVQAALTGHLVLSTLHAASADECLGRFESMGVSRSLLHGPLKLIVQQQLLAKLCRCATFDLKASQRTPFEVRKPVGCGQCNGTGYAGRVVLATATTVRGVSRDGVLLTDGSDTAVRAESARALLADGAISWQQYIDVVGASGADS